MNQLGKLLEAHGLVVSVYHASESSVDEFRNITIENLSEPNNFIIINYNRRALNEEGGGHIRFH